MTDDRLFTAAQTIPGQLVLDTDATAVYTRRPDQYGVAWDATIVSIVDGAVDVAFVGEYRCAGHETMSIETFLADYTPRS